MSPVNENEASASEVILLLDKLIELRPLLSVAGGLDSTKLPLTDVIALELRSTRYNAGMLKSFPLADVIAFLLNLRIFRDVNCARFCGTLVTEGLFTISSVSMGVSGGMRVRTRVSTSESVILELQRMVEKLPDGVELEMEQLQAGKEEKSGHAGVAEKTGSNAKSTASPMTCNVR